LVKIKNNLPKIKGPALTRGFFRSIRIEIAGAHFSELDSSWNTGRYTVAGQISPQNRLYFPVDGEGWLSHNGHDYKLTPGHAYIIPSFTALEFGCAERIAKYWSHFNVFMGDSNLDILSVAPVSYEAEIAEPGVYTSFFRRLIEIQDKGKNAMTDFDAFESDNIMRFLLQPFFSGLSAAPGMPDNKRDNRIAALLLHIDENISRPLTLDELGSAAGLSPVYLCGYFRSVMGMPPHRYCLERRIKKAVTLLWTTDLPISEIADKVGVSDLSSFSKMFKRITGLSPAGFKRQILEGKNIRF
jgi:AraC-like DNA-binding protein